MLANLPGRSKLELALRRELGSLGLNYRRDFSPLAEIRIRADLVFLAQRLAIFVNGCFWHGCPEHFHVPKTNSEWWAEKVRATVERDERQVGLLQQHGWSVMTVWEHDLQRDGAAHIASTIARQLRELPSAEELHH